VTLPPPPTISIIGSNPYNIYASSIDTYSDPGATATDENGNDVSVNTSHNVNMKVVGSYTVTYSATNAQGTTTYTRTVNIQQPPSNNPLSRTTYMTPINQLDWNTTIMNINQPITTYSGYDKVRFIVISGGGGGAKYSGGAGGCLMDIQCDVAHVDRIQYYIGYGGYIAHNGVRTTSRFNGWDSHFRIYPTTSSNYHLFTVYGSESCSNDSKGATPGYPGTNSGTNRNLGTYKLSGQTTTTTISIPDSEMSEWNKNTGTNGYRRVTVGNYTVTWTAGTKGLSGGHDSSRGGGFLRHVNSSNNVNSVDNIYTNISTNWENNNVHGGSGWYEYQGYGNFSSGSADIRGKQGLVQVEYGDSVTSNFNTNGVNGW
jgi:hypothetical protein